MDKALLERASQSERESYQAAVQKVNEAILEEIKKALNKLYKVTTFPPAYKDFPGDIDYKAFVEKLGSAIEGEAPFGLLWAIKDSEAEKSLSEIKDKESSSRHPDIFRIGHLFLSPEYNPPKEVVDIVRHLLVLFMWYKADIDLQSYFVNTHLSLAFGKLLATVSKLDTISFMKSERELKRMKKIIKTIKADIDKRKVFVIAIYEYGINLEPGTKFNKACDILQKQFNDWKGKEGPWSSIPKEMPTPSLDSIKRWLKEAGILNRDFEKEGRYWIKQT